jgi:predicted DNA-binding transcriptional regulator AlpA
MSKNILTDWDALPLVLNAADIGRVLGLSKPIVYNLFHRADFPTIHVTEKRLIVTKEAFRNWLDTQGTPQASA